MKSKMKPTRKTLIHGLIALAIFVVISLIPPVEPLTKGGIHVIGILLGLIYGLITMGNPAIPSIAALILYGIFSGVNNVMGSFMAGFGHYAVVMIIGLMLVGAVIVKTGIARTIAVNIINSKMARGKPWTLTLLIIVATYIPAMFLTIPTMIIVWEIIKNIFELAGFKKGDKWPAIMMVSVLATACFAASAMPFSMGISTDFGVFNTIAGGTQIMPAIGFLIVSIILAILFIIVEWLVIRFVLRPDVEPLKTYQGAKEPWTRDNKLGIIILIIFVILSLAGDILPRGTAIQEFFGNWGVIGAAYFTVLLGLIIPKKDKSGPIMRIQEIANDGLFWDALIMIVAVMVIAGSLGSEELGIGAWLAALLTPMMSSMSPFALFMVIILFGLIGTNILDNGVIGLTLATVLGLQVGALAIPCAALVLMSFHAQEFGILLPASSPQAAMAYGQEETGWLDRKGIFKYGLLNMAICLVVMILGFFVMPMMY